MPLSRGQCVYAAVERRVVPLPNPTPRRGSPRASPGASAARESVAGWLAEVSPRGYATAYGAFSRGDDIYADRFAAIRCPLLALTGDQDPNSTPAMARAMADAAPEGRALVIEGHRHMVNLTAPDRVSQALIDWMETPSTVEVTS